MELATRLCILVTMVGLVTLSATSSQAGPDQIGPAPGAARKVLFMCPHGAAKSVLASAYFARCEERGLNVRVPVGRNGTRRGHRSSRCCASSKTGLYDTKPRRRAKRRQTTSPTPTWSSPWAVTSLACQGRGARSSDVGRHPVTQHRIRPCRRGHSGGVNALVDELARQASPRRSLSTTSPLGRGRPGVDSRHVNRLITILACVALLVGNESLPLLHVHVYADHDHPTHQHGRPSTATSTAPSTITRRPGLRTERASLRASRTRTSCRSGPSPRLRHPECSRRRGARRAVRGREAPAPPLEARDEVRAHSPPGLTDSPLRAPPPSHPA